MSVKPAAEGHRIKIDHKTYKLAYPIAWTEKKPLYIHPKINV